MNSSVPQNILMVIPSLEMGGAQSNMLRLSTEFKRQGHRVAIVDLKPMKRDGDYVESLLHSSIPIFSPPFFSKNNRGSSLSFLDKRGKFQRGILKIRPESAWLKRLIRSRGINAVHSHMYLADLYLSKHLNDVAKRSFIRLSKQCGCYNLIEANQPTEKEAAFKEQVQQIFASLDGVVTMTTRHDEFLNRHGLGNRTQRIYNGIDLPEALTPTSAQVIRCVMCARDEATKGWEAAIYGIIEANRLGIAATLDLIGAGPHLEKLKGQFQGNEAVRFLGSLPNPMEVMTAYDIGLLPSTFKAESLPNTVVEYQAAGLATIATSIGEIPNLIHCDGLAAGCLIEPSSQEAMGSEIAQHLLEYGAKPLSLQEHKTAAQSLRGRFDIRQTALSYLDFQDEMA